ncbi:cation-translocating P-type ATPase [Polaromonas sp. JS666]|uniref:cation-translocating P-type ATPase n=1 Tax=Polaromonas sp. (strain JS666 / ATCC BAA-500) TaxID=296591 RepID=UPI000886E507|nr:cation-translocating P-type ATPase [Polaromonas sp. JS666]SDM44924.1 Ca2+-transporting ATPase [Polaromonas sp. JS666]
MSATSQAPGLSDEEAAARLRADGPNLLPGSERQSFWRTALGVVKEPMFLMLLAAGGGYLLLGDTAEAAFLLASVLLIVALTLFQERKTQRALQALRELSAPRALVLREGRELRIACRDVVRGDLLVLREGDRIAADADLQEGALEADESLLTGESVPRPKLPHPQAGRGDEPDGESGAALYAGTVVTQGRGLARVQATAGRTAMGRIGVALATTQAPASRLYRQSRRIVRGFAAAGLAVAALLVLLGWLRDGQGFVASLLPAIAFAMAVLPEEIPVVLAVFLALAAWRLSRQKILTRRVDAIEVLGAITVLAVDKTGTLTLNRMELVELAGVNTVFRAGSDAPLPQALTELAECAMLATPLKPFDPMEKAIRAFGNTRLPQDSRARLGVEPVRQYPLTPQLLAVTHAYDCGAPGRYFLACKGAPEAVMGLCRLEAHRREAVQQQVQDMAARGLRVLGVACGDWVGAGLPAGQQQLSLRFVGLLGLADPLRPTVPQAVRDCGEAGIRVIMMTGDHPVTASAIARQAGLPNPCDVLTGADIDALDDAALRTRLRSAAICARLRPEQKLRLVRALQADGGTVGMTGDGVNDAPALKAADAGIAMGERGTDVAREAAALVLLDDSFSSIATAIRQGRHVDDNIRSAVRFIFAVHAPIVALALVPALLRWPALLLPAQIVLLELIIDPACSILFEAQPADPELMRHPPRPAADSPFALRNMRYGLLQGLGLALALLAANSLMLGQGWPAAEIRTTLFLGLVAGLFLLVLVHRHAVNIFRNPWLPRLAAAVALVLSLVLWQPWLRGVMGFVLPSVRGGAWLLLILGAMTLWLLALRRVSAALQGRRP